MKKWFVGILLFCAFSAKSQNITVVDVNWLDSIKQQSANTDTLYVINFWATWCKPCVEELPYFEKLGAELANKKVKIYLVSTDMRKDLTTRLPNFVKDKALKQQVLFMNEINANKWIDKVSEAWSGAIPATWILKMSAGVNTLHEGELTEQELNQLITKYINQ
jgi:thiol-disulfide isomerase/thioredoxin